MNIFYKRVVLVSAILGILGVQVYAANTIIQNIKGGVPSDFTGVYGDKVTTIGDGDLKFINLGGDSDIVGDYFSGYYFDPAFGVFQTDANPTDRVRISGINSVSDPDDGDCGGAYDWHKLEGFSYNPNFGYMNFNFDKTTYSYICMPKDETSILEAYLGGVAYSPYIGFQSLSGIKFDSSVDLSPDVNPDGTIVDDDGAEGRFIKVEGTVASEKNTELLTDQFDGEVRILGKLTKSTFRKDVHRRVYPVISRFSTGPVSPSSPINSPYTIQGMRLGEDNWGNVSGGEKMLNDSALYFQDTEVRLGGQDDIEGQKTLVVEGANIYITGNITNIDNDGILGLIALQKNGVGGNIYIDPTVTDIHAVMYADRSLVSFNGTDELDGSTPASSLANQLYIQGSVFSENTIGASQNTPTECPYYVTPRDCNTKNEAMKYDLNFLRKYILVQPADADGNPVGGKVPQFTGQESFMGDDSRDDTATKKPGYRKYPVIIEYDPKVQTSPPPFFN